MAALLTAGVQAGASLLGGLLGNRDQKKAAQDAFNRQMALNTQAFNFQNHLNRDTFQYQQALNADAYNQQQSLLNTQNQEVRLLNDRVDAFNKDILANHSTNETRSEDTSFSQGSIDFNRLVSDAEAAGFNPLTVLRAGGLAGYSTSNVKTTNTTTSKVARDLMTYFAPSQAPQAPTPGQAAIAQAPSPGQAPQATLNNAWGDAVAAGINAWRSYDKHAAERQQLELGLARAQIDNLKSDTAANSRRFTIPTWTASNTVSTAGGFAGKVNSALGGVATPTPGEVKVTNPTASMVFDPNVRDYTAWEDSLGDLVALPMGVINAVRHAKYNWDNNTASPPPGKVMLNNLKSTYQAMVDSWRTPDPVQQRGVILDRFGIAR